MENSINDLQILVIDDDVMITTLLSMVLPSNVMVAHSGEEGLKKLEQNQKSIRLVLLDFQMPGMNGIEVLKIAKEKYPHIPVIMTTSDQHVEALATENGANGFVRKPYDADTILHLVESMATGTKE